MTDATTFNRHLLSLVLALVTVALLAVVFQHMAPSSQEPPVDNTSTTVPETTKTVDAKSQIPEDAAREVVPRQIPLRPPFQQGHLEISGLAWYGDTLVILPQYPSRIGTQHRPHLYGIARSMLEAAIRDSTGSSIAPFPIPLETQGLKVQAKAWGAHTFEGCEAIAFNGNRFFLLVEGMRDGDVMKGVLLRGTVSPRLQSLQLESASGQSLPVPSELPNMSYEALFTRGDTAYALFEANGSRVNPAPKAYRFGPSLAPEGTLSFPTLEYRLTDATALDEDGRFWITNFFYPGEREILNPAADSIAMRYGPGPSHRRSEVVERLVEYRYTPSGIQRTTTPPIWLKLSDGTGRNWEGLARFGDGFIVATDKYPETILAYVPQPQSLPHTSSRTAL